MVFARTGCLFESLGSKFQFDAMNIERGIRESRSYPRHHDLPCCAKRPQD